MLYCVVIGSVSTIFLPTKCGRIWISCCVIFLFPLRVSSLVIDVEFELLSFILSLNIAL